MSVTKCRRAPHTYRAHWAVGTACLAYSTPLYSALLCIAIASRNGKMVACAMALSTFSVHIWNDFVLRAWKRRPKTLANCCMRRAILISISKWNFNRKSSTKRVTSVHMQTIRFILTAESATSDNAEKTGSRAMLYIFWFLFWTKLQIDWLEQTESVT